MTHNWHIRFLIIVGIMVASAGNSLAQQKSDVRLPSLPDRERIDATLLTEEAEKDSSYRPSVTVSSCANGDGVEIRISDNGPGIDPSNLEEIFKPFFTTKPTGSGTGLGLSMSYDTVTQAHRGRFSVASDLGHGATFAIWIPR